MQGCMCDSAESSKTKVLFGYEIIFSVRTHYFEPIVGSKIFWTNKLSLSEKKKKKSEKLCCCDV